MMTHEEMREHRDAIGAVMVDRDMNVADALSVMGYLVGDFIRSCPPHMRLRLAKKFGDLIVQDAQISLPIL